MSKIAKLAGVAPGTIYIYFESKQELVNKLYLYIKTDIASIAFKGFDESQSVEEGFKTIWYNVAKYKKKNIKEAMFSSLCDITPMIEKGWEQKGLELLEPLAKLWIRGQKEGIIKNVPMQLLYAFSMSPLSYLISEHQDKNIKLTKELIDHSYRIAWDSIKL
nr:HTH-type transcriptional repressor FatR-like [Globicephala melas]